MKNKLAIFITALNLACTPVLNAYRANYETLNGKLKCTSYLFKDDSRDLNVTREFICEFNNGRLIKGSMFYDENSELEKMHYSDGATTTICDKEHTDALCDKLINLFSK